MRIVESFGSIREKEGMVKERQSAKMEATARTCHFKQSVVCCFSI